MTSPGKRLPSGNDLNDDLASDENMAAYEAGLARIEARLKREHPEIFGDDGELDCEIVGRLLDERLGGKTVLTGEEFSALIAPGFKRRPDAS